MSTVALENTSTSTATTTQAYVYAFDPTPAQANLLRSHIGGSRFAYNTLLGLVKDNWNENRKRKDAGEDVPKEDYLGTSHFDLLYLWSEHRDELAPWWSENGASTYNDATQRLSRAFTNLAHGPRQVPVLQAQGPRWIYSVHEHRRQTHRLPSRTDLSHR